MSVKINGTSITMTRGDTLKVIISIETEDGSVYDPVEGDSIRFALKTNYRQEEPLILKDIPLDTMLLHLTPEDTKSLAMPKTYVYDIQITHPNGDVDTFIDKAQLTLTEEVE